MFTNQKQIRAYFWEQHPSADRKLYPQSSDWGRPDKANLDYCTDTRCAFVDFVDYLHRSGLISEKLASKATL